MKELKSTACDNFYFSIEKRSNAWTPELVCEAFEKSRTSVDDGLEHLMNARPVHSLTGLMR